MALETDFKYWAFISYSHTDKKWGDWLHKALENYKVPKALVGSTTSRGEPVPGRIYPVFRDREELPTNSDLGAVIERALKQSRYLIVICSPRSARSQWVEKEILEFKRLGRENRVLAIIVEGEPNAGDKPGAEAAAECFARALRFKLGAGGEPSSERAEPIAADAREGGDGKANALLKLLAGVVGVNYDDLKRRDETRRRRQQRIVLAVSAALVLTFAALAGAALWQWREAEAQRKEALAEKQAALQTLSQSDFNQGIGLIKENRASDAIGFLIRSLSEYPDNRAARVRLTTLLEQRAWALPVLTLQLKKGIWTTAFSPDGSRIVTTSGDGTAQIWDAASGQMLTEIKYDQKQFDAKSPPGFSPDGKRIVTASEDGTARVWDIDTGRQLLLLRHQAAVTSAQYSVDGKQILTSSQDKSAVVWDAATGQKLMTVTYTGSLDYAQMSADGQRIVGFSNIINDEGESEISETVLLWNARTGRLISSIFVGDPIDEFSPDCQEILVSGYRHADVDVLDVQTGKTILKTPIALANDQNTSAQLSPDAGRLVSFSDDGTARVWDARTGLPLTGPLPHDGPVKSAYFSPDGERVVTASKDGAVRVWDARTGLLWAEPLRLHDPVDSAQFSPDGTRLLVLSNQTVSVWNLQNRGMVAGRLQTDDTNNDMDSPMALSPDAKEIATTYVVNKTTYSSKGYTEEQSGAAQVWDVQTGLPINGLLPVGRLTDVQFSPDSKLLATASMDNSARVWDAQTGRPLTKPLLHDRDVRSVAFSPDSRLLVTASWDQTARVWDAASGRLITTLKGNSTLEKAWFSLDGKKVITVTLEDVAQVWDAQTGAALLALNQNTERSGSILSEDKRWFLGKLDASHWQIWNLDSGTLFSRFPPPDPDAQQQQFSPDGRELLATGGNDAWLLDTQTGDQLIDPLPHPDAVTSAKFSPDGQCIITSCQDGMARIWDAHNGQLLADPFKPAEDVTSAQFSPDGRGILTISTSDPGSAIGNIPGFWDFVPSQTPVPDWFPPLAEAVGGEVLDQQGVIQPTTIDRVALLSRIRQTLAHSAATDDWTVWGRWFLADPSTRLISPFSKITVPQQIEQCLKQNTLPSLDEAARLSLGNAVLSRRISDARKALGPQNQ